LQNLFKTHSLASIRLPAAGMGKRMEASESEDSPLLIKFRIWLNPRVFVVRASARSCASNHGLLRSREANAELQSYQLIYRLVPD
jgi:hypothetical protein